MLVQPINSIANYNKYTVEPRGVVFKAGLRPSRDIFAGKQPLSKAAQAVIAQISSIALENGVSRTALNILVSKINDINYNVFKNIFFNALRTNGLKSLFDCSNTNNYHVSTILHKTTKKTSDFMEYYTSLGGLDSGVLMLPETFLATTLAGLNLDRFAPDTMSELFNYIDGNNASFLTAIVNKTDITDEELPAYIDMVRNYSEAEMAQTVINIEKGFGEFFSELASDSIHPIKKNLNTIDFQHKSPEFLNNFNYTTRDKLYLYDLLRYPLKSPKNIEKIYRDMSSLMERVSLNASKAYDAYEARAVCTRFFSKNFEEVFGMIALTDKETVLHILDKGFDGAHSFISMQKNLIPEDMEILAKIIKYGKRINSKGDYADISAKDKVFAFSLACINRNILANSVGELDFQHSLSEVETGLLVDFTDIRAQLKNRILNKFGFSDEDILSLKPENIDWDSRWIHLLARPEKDMAIKSIVVEASKGNFENFITSPDNKFGAANIETKKIFEKNMIDYDAWLKGIPSKNFEVAGEKLTVSLWERRPQKSLFDGSYTTCCTALDGTHGNSMAYYMLSTVFNVIEVKNQAGDVVATSRVFLINPSDPAMLVDNIEVNNTFKKKLYCNILKDKLMEEVFAYEREYAKTLTPWEMPLYFSKDNNKLYNCDDIPGLRQNWIRIDDIVGKLPYDGIYCNAITQNFIGLSRSTLQLYNISTPRM